MTMLKADGEGKENGEEMMMGCELSTRHSQTCPEPVNMEELGCPLLAGDAFLHKEIYTTVFEGVALV